MDDYENWTVAELKYARYRAQCDGFSNIEQEINEELKRREKQDGRL